MLVTQAVIDLGYFILAPSQVFLKIVIRSVGSKRIAGGTGHVVFVITVATRRRTYNLQCTYTEGNLPHFSISTVMHTPTQLQLASPDTHTESYTDHFCGS